MEPCFLLSLAHFRRGWRWEFDTRSPVGTAQLGNNSNSSRSPSLPPSPPLYSFSLFLVFLVPPLRVSPPSLSERNFSSVSTVFALAAAPLPLHLLFLCVPSLPSSSDHSAALQIKDSDPLTFSLFLSLSFSLFHSLNFYTVIVHSSSSKVATL